MMRSFENHLPAEQWHQVLAKVSHGDLCKVMLASRHINSVGSWPELWAGMRINMGKVRQDGLAHLYSINRFNKVKQMSFVGMKLTHLELERLLAEIPGSPLENVSFAWNNLSTVSPELLASTVKGLSTVNLYDTSMTADQRIKVLEASLSSTTLVDLDLGCVNLSGVPPNLLASAVKRLNTGKLSLTFMTTDQCIKVIEAILSSTTLIDLDLRGENLREVPSDLLASAVKRINNANFVSETHLTTKQCIKVLEAILSSTSLVDLDLSGVDLSGVPPDLLESTIKRTNTAKLSSTDMTTDQCIRVLVASLSSKTLIHLDLSGVLAWKNDLRGVPPELLASAVKSLNSINLSFTCLTTDQCIKVLEASLSSTTLADLDLSNVNLSEVPTNLLASAVKRLKTIKLPETHLTTDQYIKVLEASLSSTTLIHLNLSGGHLNLTGGPVLHNDGSCKLSEVPPDLLASAIKRFNTVNLSFTSLTTDQCIKVLEASLSSTTLVDLDLSFVDLSGIPANLLASAVRRLKKVNLHSSSLTVEQCVAVLNCIPSSTTLRLLNLAWNNITRENLTTDLQYLLTYSPACVIVKGIYDEDDDDEDDDDL